MSARGEGFMVVANFWFGGDLQNLVFFFFFCVVNLGSGQWWC